MAAGVRTARLVLVLALAQVAGAGANTGQYHPGLRTPSPAPHSRAPGCPTVPAAALRCDSSAPGADGPQMAHLRGGGEDPLKKHEMSLASRCIRRRHHRCARLALRAHACAHAR
jgi:hypothetical protein